MFGRKSKAQLKPPDCIARYVVLKHSQWRGKYKRILCITPTAVFTQNPDSNLTVTNTYAIAKDPDVESITIGRVGHEDTEFILTARQDKKSKFKPLKFTCKQRSRLLTDLFQCIAAATALGSAPIAARVMGSPESFHAVEWAQGDWNAVTLRLTAFSIECIGQSSGAVEWRLDYCAMSAPAVILLAPQPATQDSPAQDGLFAIKSLRVGQPPRVFGCRQCDTLVKHMQEMALKRLGVGVTVDGHGHTSVQQLMTAVNMAERQHAVEPTEVPLGEWEVERLKPRLDVLPPQVMQVVPSMQNKPLHVDPVVQPPAAPGFNTVFRRLIITRTSLLERRPDSYDVVERRPLGLVSALLRFVGEPKLLGVEWGDGSHPTLYSTPARDAALALLLDAAQVAAQRSIPVLTGFTSPGDALVCGEGGGGHGSRVEPDPEVERMYLEQLGSRGREAHSAQMHAGHAVLGTLDMRHHPDHKPDPGTSPDADGSGQALSLSLSGSPPAPKQITRDRPRRSLPPEILEAGEVLLESIFEFNACVPYSGVAPTATLDEAAVFAIVSLLPEDLRPGGTPFLTQDDSKQAVAILQCLQRLSVSPSICTSILSAPRLIQRVFIGLSSGIDPIVFECARFLTRLWAPAPARAGAGPWKMVRGQLLDDDDTSLYSSPEESNMSRAAKTLCFNYAQQADHVAALLAPLSQDTPPSPLTSLAALEALAAVVVEPGARSSDPHLVATVLQQAGEAGRPLFALFSHPAGRVADGAAVLMRTIAENGSEAASPMREAALREGSILHHLYAALFASGSKKKLSQELVASWSDEYPSALTLLRRIFPAGLVRYLNVSKQPRRPPPATPPPAAALPAATPPAADATPSNPHRTPPATPLTHAASTPVPPPSTTHANGPPMSPSPAMPPQQQSGSITPVGAQTPSRTPSYTTLAAAASAPLPQPPAGSTTPRVGAPGVQPAGTPGPTPAGALPAAGSQQDGAASNGGAAGAAAGGAAGGEGGQGAGGDTKPDSNGLPELPSRQAHTPKVAAGLRGNWEAFWTACAKDHCHAGLIWNETTRQEAKEALEKEEMSLRSKRMRVAEGAGGYPSWNWEEFAVHYPSLAKHLCIGGVYVKLLLEGVDTGAVEKVPTPREFFLALYHHLLCVASTEVQLERMAHAQAQHSSAVTSLDQQALASQELCIRAMAAVYNIHAGIIGPFDGVGHLVKVLDMTSSRSLRHNILILLQALMNPQCAETNESAKKSAKLNGYAFVESGGIDLAVDMMVSAHEVTERRPPPTSLPVQTLLITTISHEEMPREWWYYPDGWFPEGRPAATQPSPLGDVSSGSSTVAQQGDGTGRVGPVSKQEIKQMYANGTVNMLTPFMAPSMVRPRSMFEIRELRWMVSKGSGLFSGFQVAKIVLTLLLQLARLQPARDPQGSVLQPLPRVHRFLASRQCLPHIAQVMLTFEPELVSLSASLLEVVLQDNEDMLPLLYQTGVFYFALAYCGSNLAEVARLFKLAHLRQYFRGTLDAQGGLPLAQRSYLGHLVPESLLYVLETYGAESFAQSLAGDTDSPELVWTHAMRAQNLIPQLLSHLGDFPCRLMQNNHALYDYTPLPPLQYPELKEEIWCHRYYLRNLCDEERFRGWPIVDHVPLLQALLAEWRTELTRQPLSMSEAEACQVLGIAPAPDGSVGEEEMRRAYRAMARKYHPDKNPQGRHIFLQVQKAYERLQAGSAGGQGPQTWRIQLMLRAQCIVFKHHSEVMKPYKYAGYNQLLEVVQSAAAVETGQDHFLSAEKVELVQAAVELCWLTCVCCQLNAEELMRCSGIDVLAELLARCVSVLPPDSPPHAPAAVITTNVLRTMAGLAAVARAREEMVSRRTLVLDIVKCCDLERAPAAVDAALICIAYMAASEPLQTLLMECGVLGYVVPKLLDYDVTLEPEAREGMVLPFSAETGPAASFHVLESPLVRPNMAVAKSYHAVLALQALARLAGLLAAPNQTPTCSDAQVVLRVLLTESLTLRMGSRDPWQLLQDINSSLETPQVIWNNSMRDELRQLMEAQRSQPNIPALLNFQYSCLKQELVVGGIFIRVYNARPTALHADASNLCKGLIRFMFDLLVSTYAPFFAEVDALGPVERTNLLAVLTALAHLLEAEPRLLGLLASKSAMSPLIACLYPAATRALDTGADGAPDLLPPAAPLFEAQMAAASLAILARLTQNAGCVEALMEEQSVRLMYWLAYNPPSQHCLQAVLHLLHTLAGQTQVAWVAAGQAGLLYLLSILLHVGKWPWPGEAPSRSVEEEIKAGVSSLLGRLMVQPMHGQRIILTLNKLLPPGMVDMLKEGPGEAVLKALVTTVETPECLWDSQMAAATATEVCTLAAQARQQQTDGSHDWSLPAAFSLEFDKLRGELYVGGVYVRLFLKNPKYQLRNPKRFAEGLMERYVAELGKGSASDYAVLLSAASVAVLRTHPLLADHVAQLGYVPRLLAALAARKMAATRNMPTSPPRAGDAATAAAPGVAPSAAPDEVGGTILRVLHQLAESNVAAEAMAASMAYPAVITFVESLVWGEGATILVLETLKRILGMHNRQRDLLVSQGLQAGLVPMLLNILDWRRQAGGAPSGSEAAAAQQQDSGAQRALAVDVLRLMMLDGAYAGQVSSMLDASEVWHAHRDQLHDLYLPKGAQEAGVVGLLTNSATATYALPAPDALSPSRPKEPTSPMYANQAG